MLAAQSDGIQLLRFASYRADHLTGHADALGGQSFRGTPGYAVNDLASSGCCHVVGFMSIENGLFFAAIRCHQRHAMVVELA